MTTRAVLYSTLHSLYSFLFSPNFVWIKAKPFLLTCIIRKNPKRKDKCHRRCRIKIGCLIRLLHLCNCTISYGAFFKFCACANAVLFKEKNSLSKNIIFSFLEQNLFGISKHQSIKKLRKAEAKQHSQQNHRYQTTNNKISPRSFKPFKNPHAQTDCKRQNRKQDAKQLPLILIECIVLHGKHIKSPDSLLPSN